MFFKLYTHCVAHLQTVFAKNVNGAVATRETIALVLVVALLGEHQQFVVLYIVKTWEVQVIE